MKPRVYFVTTLNCNYKCRHYYIEAGPGLEDTTISEKDFQKVIRNLPKVSMGLTLTGGEVFTIPDTLYSFLDYVTKENKKRKIRKQGSISVGVQTNGFWATNDQKTKSVLFDLYTRDVSELDISGSDKYHFEQGADSEKLRRFADIVKASQLFDFYGPRGSFTQNNLDPVGRAKNMKVPKSRLYIKREHCRHALDDYYVEVMNDGQVSICPPQNIFLPGNAIKKPIVDIIRSAKKNPRLKLLNDKGIRGVALEDGWRKRDIKDLIDIHGECGTCFRLYDQNIV